MLWSHIFPTGVLAKLIPESTHSEHGNDQSLMLWVFFFFLSSVTVFIVKSTIISSTVSLHVDLKRGKCARGSKQKKERVYYSIQFTSLER
jgi:hypothetical protein